jgi:hypothetical protein
MGAGRRPPAAAPSRIVLPRSATVAGVLARSLHRVQRNRAADTAATDRISSYFVPHFRRASLVSLARSAAAARVCGERIRAAPPSPPHHSPGRRAPPRPMGSQLKRPKPPTASSRDPIREYLP